MRDISELELMESETDDLILLNRRIKRELARRKERYEKHGITTNIPNDRELMVVEAEL